MARRQTLTEEQRAEFMDAFFLFDKIGDGKIEAYQVGDVCRALGLNPPQAIVRKIQDDVNERMNGERLTFDEFMPIYSQLAQQKDPGSAADFVEGLRMFDKDGSGMISVMELRHILTNIGEKLTNPEVDKLLTELHTENGEVNYEDFIRLVMSE